MIYCKCKQAELERLENMVMQQSSPSCVTSAVNGYNYKERIREIEGTHNLMINQLQVVTGMFFHFLKSDCTCGADKAVYKQREKEEHDKQVELWATDAEVIQKVLDRHVLQKSLHNTMVLKTPLPPADENGTVTLNK